MPHPFTSDLIELLPRLRRFAISLTGSRDRADDLVQTACEKALRNASSWQPGTRFDAWMFRITRNAFIDSLRKLKTAGPQLDIDDYAELIGGQGEPDVVAKMTLDEVWKGIGKLSVDQREVLLLTCVEEMSYAEAAEVLDIPVGTVMSRLARAREKLAPLAGIDRAGKR